MPNYLQGLDFRTVVLGLLPLGVGIVSLILAIRSSRESKRVIKQNNELKELLNMERQNFTWEDIHRACHALAAKLRDFKPDYIITTPASPMAVTGIVLEELLQ